MSSNIGNQFHFHHPVSRQGVNFPNSVGVNVHPSGKPLNPVHPTWSNSKALNVHSCLVRPQLDSRTPPVSAVQSAEHNISLRISTAYPIRTVPAPDQQMHPVGTVYREQYQTKGTDRTKCFSVPSEMLNVSSLCDPSRGTPESVQYQYNFGEAGILRITQTLQPRIPSNMPSTINSMPPTEAKDRDIIKPTCTSSVNITLNKPDDTPQLANRQLPQADPKPVPPKDAKACCQGNRMPAANPKSGPVMYTSHFCTHVAEKVRKTSSSGKEENVHRIGPIFSDEKPKSQGRNDEEGGRRSSKGNGKPRIVHIDVYCSSSSSDEECLDDPSSWDFVSDRVSYSSGSGQTVISRKCSSISRRNDAGRSNDRTTVSSRLSTDTIKRYPSRLSDDSLLAVSSIRAKEKRSYLVSEPPSSESCQARSGDTSLQSSIRSETSSIRSIRPGIRRHFGEMHRPKNIGSSCSMHSSICSADELRPLKKSITTLFGSRKATPNHIKHTGPIRNKNCACESCRRFFLALSPSASSLLGTDSNVGLKVNEPQSDPVSDKKVHVGKD